MPPLFEVNGKRMHCVVGPVPKSVHQTLCVQTSLFTVFSAVLCKLFLVVVAGYCDIGCFPLELREAAVTWSSKSVVISILQASEVL